MPWTWCQIASGQIFNMDAIGELANLLMVRMLAIHKRGVTTHLTWPSCILIYVNKLVNMQITAGRRFFANSRRRSSTNGLARPVYIETGRRPNRPPIGGSGRLLFPTAGAAGGARFVYTLHSQH